MSHFINIVRRLVVELAGPLEGELHIRLIYETCPPLQRRGAWLAIPGFLHICQRCSRPAGWPVGIAAALSFVVLLTKVQLQKIGIHWELATGTAGLECIFFEEQNFRDLWRTYSVVFGSDCLFKLSRSRRRWKERRGNSIKDSFGHVFVSPLSKGNLIAVVSKTTPPPQKGTSIENHIKAAADSWLPLVN